MQSVIDARAREVAPNLLRLQLELNSKQFPAHYKYDGARFAGSDTTLKLVSGAVYEVRLTCTPALQGGAAPRPAKLVFSGEGGSGGQALTEDLVLQPPAVQQPSATAADVAAPPAAAAAASLAGGEQQAAGGDQGAVVQQPDVSAPDGSVGITATSTAQAVGHLPQPQPAAPPQQPQQPAIGVLITFDDDDTTSGAAPSAPPAAEPEAVAQGPAAAAAAAPAAGAPQQPQQAAGQQQEVQPMQVDSAISGQQQHEEAKPAVSVPSSSATAPDRSVLCASWTCRLPPSKANTRTRVTLEVDTEEAGLLSLPLCVKVYEAKDKSKTHGLALRAVRYECVKTSSGARLASTAYFGVQRAA